MPAPMMSVSDFRSGMPLYTDLPTPYEYGVGREFPAVVADDRLTCGCR